MICSSWKNFPTTCIEAECCGTEIYGFDKCGTKETFLGDVSMYKEADEHFVEYGDVEALAEVTMKLLTDKVDADKLSSKAKEAFSSQRMCNDYLNLYKAVK